MTEIPKEHPRYESLLLRERVVEAYHDSVLAAEGLIAHGRGEAFDYLLGEKSPDFARRALIAAACAFLLAERPVISVNGNVAALCPGELVELSEATGAPLEVNLFYRTRERELAIAKVLQSAGARTVLGVGDDARGTIPELSSERRRVDPRGIGSADLVFVPLEDGDRTEALIRLGKQVVTVDLNPLSRTAQAATITIVDNIVRVLPALIHEIDRQRRSSPSDQRRILDDFHNGESLSESLVFIANRLQSLARDGRPED